ncbi:MAG TPA: hypothetical protein VI756_20445 [Blastocatellia bacterium]
MADRFNSYRLYRKIAAGPWEAGPEYASEQEAHSILALQKNASLLYMQQTKHSYQYALFVLEEGAEPPSASDFEGLFIQFILDGGDPSTEFLYRKTTPLAEPG